MQIAARFEAGVPNDACGARSCEFAELDQLRRAGFRAVLITSPAARSEARQAVGHVEPVGRWFAESGVHADRTYHIPAFSWDALLSVIACAADELDVDMQRSWLVGSGISEIRAARKAGVKSIQLEARLDDAVPFAADFTIPGIREAVEFITDGYARLLVHCRSFESLLQLGDVVLVGGLSRSGKTTFANLLRWSLLEQGCRAWTLSLDRWLKDVESRSPGVLGRYDLSVVRDVVVRHVLDRIPQALALPEYHKLEQRAHFTGESILIQPEDILIIEGTVALTLAPRLGHVHRIFVDIDESERKRRVINEYLLRGKSEIEAAAIYNARQVDERPDIVHSSLGATRVDISHCVPVSVGTSSAR